MDRKTYIWGGGPPPARTRRGKSVLREYAEALGFAVLAALVIRALVVQAFKIPSGSMEDTLLVGDYLLANKFVYGTELPLLNVRIPGLRDPEPGDIVIFACPADLKRDYIKRCVATGGQTVEVRDKVLYVDGAVQALPPMGKHADPQLVPGNYQPRDNFGPYTVPAGEFFCMGDNRDNSYDSRYWGPVPRRLIKGRALLIYMSIDKSPEVSVLNLLRKIRWKRIGRIIR